MDNSTVTRINIAMQNGKPFLSINDSLFSYSDLDSVVNMDYMSEGGMKTDEYLMSVYSGQGISLMLDMG